MNAWLITWEGTSRSLNDGNRLIAIIGSRRSERYISDIVEFTYLRATSTADGLIYVANRPKRKEFGVVTKEVINGVPHSSRISCGENPWIYARRVTDLGVTINIEKSVEVVCWREPHILTWVSEERNQVKTEKEGAIRSLTRSTESAVSCELELLTL